MPIDPAERAAAAALGALPDEDFRALYTEIAAQERAACESSLAAFLRASWRWIDPSPYIHGWHIDAIAEHLEAVTRGDVRRLIVTVPPRHCKSLECAVAWPLWSWIQPVPGPLAGPQVRWLTVSYGQDLAERDALRARRVIATAWFQRHWGRRVIVTGDQDARRKYETTAGGARLSTSVGGRLTGEGGDVLLVDDSINAAEASSDAVLDALERWWRDGMQSRFNDPRHGAVVLIQQRLHERDLVGIVKSDAPGDWVHLNLPAEYVPARRCVTPYWRDPRTTEGEPLWPERMPAEELARLRRTMGAWAYAAQYQQDPVPQGGGIIKAADWQRWTDAEYPELAFVLVSLDPAYTSKDENDYSACTVWGVYHDAHDRPQLLLLHAWRDRLPIAPLVTKLIETARRWGADRVLIEAKASGISVGQEMLRLAGGESWGVELVDPKGDKVARAWAVQHLWDEGVIWAPERPWADAVIAECASFPRGAHDDWLDSTTQAVRWLRLSGMALRTDERERQLDARLLPAAETRRRLPYDVG